MIQKLKKHYKEFLIIILGTFYLSILIIEKFKFFDEIKEVRILLISSLIISALIGARLIIDFDKNHKVISSIIILLFILIFFNYLKDGIAGLNKIYIDELS